MEDYLLYAAGAGVLGLIYEKFMAKEIPDEEDTKQVGGNQENLVEQYDNTNIEQNGGVYNDTRNHEEDMGVFMDPDLELREGGIDLTNVSCGKWNDKDAYQDEPIELYSNNEEMKYFPMFKDYQKAIDASPTNGFHLVIPGLLPAPNSFWKMEEPEGIWLMPNDSKPHHHGDAPHHLVEWDINEVFELSDKKFHSVENKKITKYRGKKEIISFYEGESNSAIETWIHWRIPYDKKDYPVLVVKKHSIIWWDYFKTHTLALVETEEEYEENNFDRALMISSDEDKKSETVVTIMNKRGTFYFVCTIEGHAELGHKIVIKVI